VVARPFNVYGPRQSARAVIPSMISQLAAGVREVQLGDLTTTRDFTYVEDTCRGFLAIAALDGGAGEVFHIGANHEITIADLFALIADTMGIAARAVLDPQRLRPAASEVLRLWCDNRKLAAATGFTPQVSLADGLARTVAWFRDPDNLRRYKPDRYHV
jgi:nucleoside-diphosphate-sugar epimerase